MIKFENASKFYGNNLALKNLNLEIKDGEIFGLLGHNGAGKTTTIKALIGMIELSEGKILVGDDDISKNPIEIKKRIGYVADSPDLFLRLTPLDLFGFLAKIYEVSDELRDERVNELADVFEFTALNQTIASLSHGNRQKVFIIGALLSNPDIWILDEPLTGLDPQSSFRLKEMMKNHAKEGNTVLFSTHMLEIAEALCDRIGILRKGELIFLGTMEELKIAHGNTSLEEIYLNLIGSYNPENIEEDHDQGKIVDKKDFNNSNDDLQKKEGSDD